MEFPLKAMLGKSAEDFIAVKVDWLCGKFPRLVDDVELRLLDYGCGTGALLRVLRGRHWRAELAGCDISGGMLETARVTWPSDLGSPPELTLQDGSLTSYPSSFFDVVIISAVLHHVPPADRDGVIAEIRRVLKPGGHIVIFEHNPLNPVTLYVTERTPIDKNAILLSSSEATALLTAQSFAPPATEYIMFTPPRMPVLRFIDNLLRWCPLGAQYVTFASRPE
jgi:ubiquinone/menaquinone biosynthesis C-methylase UbiE